MVEKLRFYFFNPVFTSTLILLFVFYTPVFNLKFETGVLSLLQLTDFSRVDGQILSTPVKSEKGKYYSAQFRLDKCWDKNNLSSTCNGKIKILIPTEFVEAHYPGKLYSISNSTNNCIYEKGGLYTFEVKPIQNGLIVKDCIENHWDNSFTGKTSYFRSLFRLQFKRLMFNWGKAGGLLLALLSGAKEYTEDSITNAFKFAGLSHILALSGMHLSMFSGIAMFIGKKSKRKKLSFIIRIISLILFVWFAGFSPSLLRAFICAVLVLLASIIDIPDPDMLIILCTSFLIQIVISPTDIPNLGFILSYGALAGILIFNKTFHKLYIKFISKYFSASISSSTSAQIITVPICFKNFGFYSPIGIIATCFVSPLISLFIYTGLVCIVLSLIFPFMANISAIFMNFLYNIIKYIVLTFAKVPVWRLN